MAGKLLIRRFKFQNEKEMNMPFDKIKLLILKSIFYPPLINF